MKKTRLRALVLAAGYGSRLRPLTAFIPKPLLPIRGTAGVAYTLDTLAAMGCEGIAINLHHHGTQIRDALGESRAGVPLVYSIETDLRGTLGAIAPLRGFLEKAETVLVINGDSLCKWPLHGLVRRHRRSGSDATLLVSKRVDPQAFGGGVEVEDHKRIVSLRPSKTGGTDNPRRVFMGAHAISPHLLARVSTHGESNFVEDLYEPLLSGGGQLAALETSRKWHDLGTPERYRRAVLDWGTHRGWRSPEARLERGVNTRGSVIEARAVVCTGSRIHGSVILPGARIGEGCRIVESIVGPDVNLPPKTSVHRRMVTRVRKEVAASRYASIVGGLVYEPI